MRSCHKLATANLAVRSIPMKSKSLPSIICTSAMSMWSGAPARHRSEGLPLADEVALELLPPGSVAFDIRQARDAFAMALEPAAHHGSSLHAPLQRRPHEVRDRGLQGLKAVIQWQERMATVRHDHCFLGLGQYGGPRLRRPGLHIFDSRPLAPLRHPPGIDALLPAQRRERSLRSFGPSPRPMAGWP